MIYELRTYTLKIGAVPEFLRISSEHMPYRVQFSPLAAFWVTDIGPLNQVVHLWPYESMEQRAQVRREASKEGKWPPPLLHLMEDQASEILVPFPSNPELKAQQWGPIFELRSYSFQPGTAPQIQAAWESKIAGRAALSPCLGAWTTEMGPLNKLIHIWPYKSLQERTQTRQQAIDSGVWPAPIGEYLLTMETRIMLPAPYSPIQ